MTRITCEDGYLECMTYFHGIDRKCAIKGVHNNTLSKYVIYIYFSIILKLYSKFRSRIYVGQIHAFTHFCLNLKVSCEKKKSITCFKILYLPLILPNGNSKSPQKSSS